MYLLYQQGLNSIYKSITWVWGTFFEMCRSVPECTARSFLQFMATTGTEGGEGKYREVWGM
jgi:hypothetical protein